MSFQNYLNKVSDKYISLVSVFEKSIYLIVSIILFAVSLIAGYRIFTGFFVLLESSTQILNITYENFQMFFGKVLTLLIILELNTSILHAIKKHEIKILLLDVILISGTAISRKLITMDYIKMEPESVWSIAILLTSVGLSYFLIRRANQRRNKN